jgi:hypothetical protein
VIKNPGLIGPWAIPWFTAETWPELLTVAADRADLPDTFAEFELIAGRKFERLRAQGVPLHRVLVSIPEMAAWCRANGFRVDAPGRAAFAAFVAMRRAAVH